MRETIQTVAMPLKFIEKNQACAAFPFRILAVDCN
jgi:hypothetical protein